MYMYVHCWKNPYSQVHVHVHVLHMYYNVHVHVSAIQFLQDTNDFQQAEQILNKVVQIEPDNPLGHFSLGSVDMYMCQGCIGSVVYICISRMCHGCVRLYSRLHVRVVP